jgi:hypothetical protein
MEINKTRAKRQRGKTALAPADKRTHCVSVRLNQAELELLNNKRGNMKQGEWLRCAAIDKLPPIVPEANIKKWVELANAANNINQIAKKLNNNPSIDNAQFIYIKQLLNEFRDTLIGVSIHERDAKD